MSTPLNGPGSATSLGGVPGQRTSTDQGFGSLLQNRQGVKPEGPSTPSTPFRPTQPLVGTQTTSSMSRPDPSRTDVTTQGPGGSVTVSGQNRLAPDPGSHPFTALTTGTTRFAGTSGPGSSHMEVGGTVAPGVTVMGSHTSRNGEHAINAQTSGTITSGSTSVNGSVRTTVMTTDSGELPGQTVLSGGAKTQIVPGLQGTVGITHTIHHGEASDVTRASIGVQAQVTPTTQISATHSRNIGSGPANAETSLSVDHRPEGTGVYVDARHSGTETRVEAGFRSSH